MQDLVMSMVDEFDTEIIAKCDLICEERKREGRDVESDDDSSSEETKKKKKPNIRSSARLRGEQAPSGLPLNGLLDLERKRSKSPRSTKDSDDESQPLQVTEISIQSDDEV
jgi:hypothetical protein